MRQRYRLAVALVILALVLVGCDWPLDRFDPARTANNPYSGLSTSNASHLGVVWSAPTGGGALIANGLVLTPRAPYTEPPGMKALNLTDGSVRWTSEVPVRAVEGGVGYGVRNDLTPGYVLFAVALDTGRTLWSGASQPNSGSVIGVADGMVYVQTSNGSGHGVMPEMDVWDASTHQLAWKKLNAADFSEPAVANGIAYVNEDVYLSGVVLDAVDERTGSQRWSIKYPSSCPGASSPVISNGYLFWSGATFKANDGTLVSHWPVCTTTDPSFAVVGTTIYAERPGTSAGTADVVAFDGITGAVHWSYDGVRTAGEPGLNVIAFPIVADDVVFVSTSAGPNTLETATIGFNATTGHPIALLAGAAASVADGTLITNSSHGTLNALRPG